MSSMSFGGFGNDNSNNKVSISYIIGVPIPEQINDPELVIAFKSMLKNSETTREKGIQQFQHMIEMRPDCLDPDVQWQWTLIYPKLAVDTSVSVRLSAQKTQGLICEISGKQSQKYIKYAIGPWLCGLYDQATAVAKATQESLIRVFPATEKRESLWRLFREKLINFAYECICLESTESVYDARYVSQDKAHDGYQRLEYSCVKVLINLLARKEGKNSSFRLLLDDSKFWKLCYCGNLALQRSLAQFIRALITEDSSLASEYSDKMLSVVVKSASHIDKSLAGFLPDSIRTLIMISTTFPQIWNAKSISKSKQAIEKLVSTGSKSSAEFWTSIPDLINVLPGELRPTEKTLIQALKNEKLSNIFTKGAEAIAKIYPESISDIFELVCVSNLRFNADFYHNIGTRCTNLEDNSLDHLVTKCAELDRTAGDFSKVSHMEKAILLLKSTNTKSAEVSKYVSEALKDNDAHKLPLVLTVLNLTDLYEVTEKDFDGFVTKITESTDSLDDTIVQIFIHGKKSQNFMADFERLVDSIERKDQEIAINDFSKLLANYKSFSGSLWPNEKLSRFIERTGLSFQHGMTDFIVYSVCAHDVLVSQQASFSILEKLSDELEISPRMTLQCLEKIALIDKDIIPSFIENHDKGPKLASNIFAETNDSQNLLGSLADKIDDLSLKAIRGDLANIQIDDMELELEMGEKLWKKPQETLSFLEEILSSEKYDVSIPDSFLTKHHEGLLLAQRKESMVSDHVIAIALFVARILKAKRLKPNSEIILSLAVIDELCQARMSRQKFEHEVEGNELNDMVTELLNTSRDELIDLLFQNTELTPLSFYHGLIFKRLVEDSCPSRLFDSIGDRKDFIAQVILPQMKDNGKYRNKLSNELVSVSGDSMKLDLFVTLNNLMNTEGQRIPMNRLGMILKNVRDAMESDDAYEESFASLRIEMTYFLQFVVQIYHSELLSTHWDTIIDVIEQNLAIIMVQEHLKSIVLYYTFSLYLTMMQLSPNVLPESCGESLENLPSQIIDTFSTVSQAGPLLGKITQEMSAFLVAQNGITDDFDTSELYLSLEKADNIAFMDAVSALLLKNVDEKQEKVSMEYELSKSTSEAILEPAALNIISTLPTNENETFRYLVAWLLLLGHFDKSSYELRRKYIEQLHSPMHNMLNFIWKTGLKDVVKRENIEQYEFISDKIQSDVLARHVFFKVVTYAHSVVRGWYLGQRNAALCHKIEEFTKKNITPLVLKRELDSVTEASDADFTIEKRDKSVRIHYQVDEQECLFDVSFTDAYPLQDITITTDRLVGISPKRWRGWSATMRAISISQNGRLNEILNVLKRSVSLYFEGVQECAICYAVIHSDLTLPDKTCSTCKKKFHTECLYRWFKSSNDSACPLCRSKFKFKTRQGPNPLMV